MLNQRTREQLVLLVNSGKNTYADIKQAIPELADADLRIASLPMRINELSERVLNLGHFPPGDKDRYEFAADDKFSLSWYGEDLLHKVQKELQQEKISIDALNEAKEARRVSEEALAIEKSSLAINKAALEEAHESKRYAMIAAITAIISVLITLCQLG